ncbi:MAG: metalloregulator ArsR/SmtB family transcription factor [Clostridiales bacterium]|nr:metalloregulator ArsR/SmtB family transcription factor [Clostridiales bacterium]
MIEMKTYEKKAELLKALAHPHRLCILRGLLENGCNVSKIQECLNLPQSTISTHLSRLRASGIVEGERRGTEVCYRVSNEDVGNIIRLLFSSYIG